jgi:hypothetical protein
MKQTIQIIKRIIAVFAATALGVLGAGSLVGIDVYKAALMAGVGGIATVIERLSRAYLEDGVLNADEINAAFSSVASQSNSGSGYAPADVSPTEKGK